jgi:ribonuclease HII
MPPRPDLRQERALLRAGACVVVGMDEVGRGALAGPVSVGVVAVDARTRACPPGVADSKLLSPPARERLLPAIGRWGLARAVGHATPAEIDAVGIIAALRLAGRRALAALPVRPDVVLLDGSHDWLSGPRQGGLFEVDRLEHVQLAGALGELADVVVRTRVKADRSCASVAAASVLAKCERDALMVRVAADHPAYGWAENKGYGAPEHLAALRELGPTPLHRCSWRLPAQVAGNADAGGPVGVAPSGELDTAAGPGRGWSMMDA